MKRIMVVELLMFALCGALPMLVRADDVAQSIIDGTAGSTGHGVLGVNMASGDTNLQSNAVAVSINHDGNATAHVHTEQTIDGASIGAPDAAVSRIDGDAFLNATGAIGINQASGGANAQANNVAIAVGSHAEVTPDVVLEQSVSGLPPETLAAHGQQRESTVAGTAFSGARGIVQVNQSAGVANATGNTFAMRVHLGETP